MRHVLCLLIGSAGLIAGSIVQAAELHVEPAAMTLEGHFARGQFVVRTADTNGSVTPRSGDRTHEAVFTSADETVVRVIGPGRVLAVGDGETTIRIEANGDSTLVPVTVTGTAGEPRIAYDSHVSPVLNKLGCNMGACHASQYGKGGFKLSVFGFDPRADHLAVIRDRQQRRVNLLDPDRSLFLRKPTMETPHGGGLRLRKDAVDYRVLAEWIRGGAPGPVKDAATVTGITITPSRRVAALADVQHLRVTAEYSDGKSRDVTAWAKFDTMDDAVLKVSSAGRVEVVGRGQAPVMVRFEGRAEIAMFAVPFAEDVKLADWSNHNFVDELAAAKFRELGIEPSPICDDATFLRRVYFDLIGTLPTIEETRAFLESDDPDKRNRLVDRLLGLTGDPKLDVHNDQYAAYWTLKWSDLLRNKTVGNNAKQAMWSLHNWLKESFRTNKPFDDFVAELVTGKGSVYSNGPANFFRINANSSDLAESTAQTFMGIRLQCAKCHHHPFEKYGQEDYYAFAAFFARVGNKTSQEFGLFGRETVVVVKASGEVRHPRTGKNLPPTTLDGRPKDHPLDRRIALAEWLVSDQNEAFARSIVNRYVSYLLGRGLVEPVDDMRATNPPTNPELMDALAEQFVESGYDVKQLLRTIARSRLYQLSSQPTTGNASDDRFYSHYSVKRIPAEPLLDAIDRATGVPTKFRNLPLGTRAIELPDAEYPNYFLATFGKPRRASVCECERMPDPNLAQTLHTLNGDTLTNKIADGKGRVAALLTAETEHAAIVEELYLTTLNRPPTDEERSAADRFLAASPSPKECYEDLLWALMNSKQFLFVR